MGRAQVITKHSPATVQGAQQIIERAIKNEVSDIHIEPGERFVLVRYRRGGLLYTANKLPKTSAIPLAIYLKNMAGLNPLQTQMPQIGQYQLQLGRNNYKLEIATLPVLDGEKITIILSNDNKTAPDLTSLGLWGNSLTAVERSLTRTKGIILIAGHQNSPITATLTALLMLLEGHSVKRGFISIETNALPSSLKSIAVQPEVGLSLSRQLALLIQDNFTVVGINNLSDKKTAKVAIEAATNGCLILAGILANNATSGMTLMQRMYPRHTTAVSIDLAVGQIFVPRLCPHCREAYQLSSVEQQQLSSLFQLNKTDVMQTVHKLEKKAAQSGIEPEIELSSNNKGINNLWKARLHGCKTCDHTGFISDVGIFEVCIPNDQIYSSLVKNQTSFVLRQTAIKDGMISLSVDGLIKALRGLIDMPTLLSICSIAN